MIKLLKLDCIRGKQHGMMPNILFMRSNGGEMGQLKLIIDTDIGDEIDDALALYYAMRCGIEIVGITTVYKNTGERARIAKRLLSLYGKGYEKVPVYAGHGTPIAERESYYPHTCHYHTLLDNECYAPDGGAEEAVDFIIDSCERYGDELAVVAIGPFTNLARVIEKAPDALEKAKRVVIMGGAFYRQYADWNVMCDVEGAAEMFASLKNLECMGADVTHLLPLAREQYEAICACRADRAAEEIARLTELWSHVNPDRYPTLHDPLAVRYAVCPEAVETERAEVAVITEGYARGITLNIDAYNKAYMNEAFTVRNAANTVTVGKSIDAENFIATFIDAFK